VNFISFAQSENNLFSVAGVVDQQFTLDSSTNLVDWMIAEGKAAKADSKTFIYVNNRLEGNALETIDAMLSDEE
jgi:hypothetical protein